MGATWTSRTGLASAAALLLAGGGLAAFLLGERSARQPAEPPPATRAGSGRPAPRAYPVPELATEVPYRGYSVPYSAAAAPGADGEAVQPGSDAARELAASMAKLVSDLEWNANRGLPEPPQQVVAPMPEPWRPPKDAAGAPEPIIEQVVPARASGKGGARVTIKGRHLRVADVMFGASPASIVSRGEREVVVIAPPSPPGPTAIALTNTDGTFAIAGSGFTYSE